ncbi:MAG: HAD-IA family hydrolase [Duodenibacillus sp.]|nr:HAD-IA family hydrolase [Duodenibacillus sp.]
MPSPGGIVLFDLDGTLVDSAPDLCAAANWLRERAGLPALPLRCLRDASGKGARGLIWAALRIPQDAPAFPALRDAFLARYSAHLADASRPFAGVAPMLDALEDAGLAWGVVTNKHAWLARPLAEAFGLAGRARCIICGDMVAQGKPSPLSLRLALEATGFDAGHAVYVGDDARDMAAARAAGMPGIAAAWGYTGMGPAVADWGADRIAGRPEDVTSAALGLLAR